MGLRRGYDTFDRFQQRHRWLGFPLAVRQKYSDDQGGYLAATVTYYGFFAIFPLLLVFTSALGFVVHGNRSAERSVLHSTLAQFPVVGRALQVHALQGSAVALAVGLAGALWSGMGVFLAAENAMNQLWGIPFRKRPDFFRARGKAFVLLVALGGGAVVATVLGSLGGLAGGLGLVGKVIAVVASTGLNFVLFWVAFRVLTTRDVGWKDVRGGAVAAAILYTALQVVGGVYVSHLRHANDAYGTFGLVIGLLSWIYLAVHITLLAAEGNVVARYRLWPRSFSVVFEQPSTDADRRALTLRGRVEERRGDETVDVSFPPGE